MMTLSTLINEEEDGTSSVTTILKDATGNLLAEKTEQFTCREVAINVVAGLRDWAREKGIGIGITDV